MNNKYSHTVIQ